MNVVLLIALSGPCQVGIQVGGAPPPVGLSYGDWMTREDAYAVAKELGAIGITAEVYCRAPKREHNERIAV